MALPITELGVLFRSSRPDYIETIKWIALGRTVCKLFRSSRPDYIETYVSTIR